MKPATYCDYQFQNQSLIKAQADNEDVALHLKTDSQSGSLVFLLGLIRFYYKCTGIVYFVFHYLFTVFGFVPPPRPKLEELRELGRQRAQANKDAREAHAAQAQCNQQTPVDPIAPKPDEKVLPN